MNRNKVLITGGAGYVGAALSRFLLNKGYLLKIYDKFYFGRKPIEDFPIEGNEFIEGDIRHLPDDLFDGVNTVIHLAGLSNDPTADFNPEANCLINTAASIDLGRYAKEAGVTRFVFASTASIYDAGINDLASNVVRTEGSCVYPKHYYSHSKYMAEKGLLKLCDDKFAVVILRKGTIHGVSSRMRYDLVVNMMVRNALVGDKIKVFCGGQQWRPLIDIHDITMAYYLAMTIDADDIGGEIFNIAQCNYQIKDLAIAVRNAVVSGTNLRPKIVFERNDLKDRSYRISTKKADKILGFRATVGINDSVRRLIKEIKDFNFTDFDNPIYYNIKWMEPILSKEGK